METLNCDTVKCQTTKEKFSDCVIIDVECNEMASKDVKVIQVPKPMKKPKKLAKTKETKIVKLDTTSTVKTLVINQEVNRQNIKCIIHINTNVFDKKETKSCKKHRLKNKKCSDDSIIHKKYIGRIEIATKDRVVPCCLRDKCRAAILAKSGKKTKDKLNVTRSTESQPQPNNKKKKKSKKRRCSKHMHHRANKEPMNNTNSSFLSNTYLSPILTEKEDVEADPEITYDSISTNSLMQSDGELDTLITGTKHREHDSTTFHVNEDAFVSIKEHITDNPEMRIMTSTPFNSEDNTVFSAEMDVSIHSMATVILAPKLVTGIYSPTLGRTPTCSPIESFYPDFNDSRKEHNYFERNESVLSPYKADYSSSNDIVQKEYGISYGFDVSSSDDQGSDVHEYANNNNVMKNTGCDGNNEVMNSTKNELPRIRVKSREQLFY